RHFHLQLVRRVPTGVDDERPAWVCLAREPCSVSRGQEPRRAAHVLDTQTGGLLERRRSSRVTTSERSALRRRFELAGDVLVGTLGGGREVPGAAVAAGVVE